MTLKKIKNILVPLDGSPNSFRGLDYAIGIAQNCHATVTGMYITPLSPPESPEQKGYIRNFLLKNAKKFMEKAELRCGKNGVLFHYRILYGDEGPKIVKFAHDKKFDMIVIGSRGRSTIKEMFLGSTSNYVIHKSKIPILVVK